MADLTGISEKEAEGRDFGDVLPQLEGQLDKVRGTIRDGRTMENERFCTRTAGEATRYFDLRVFPLVADGAQGAVVRLDDITSRVQIEDMMVQTEKMMSVGGLAAGMAHEINNPLTGILTYSSMLLEDCENPEHRDDLQLIVDETLRCRKIVKEVLDFARETQLDRQPANINEIINSTISILERHVSFQNITIKKYLAIDIPDTMLDINQFKSVINNLALNAADAMKDGGILTIMTRMDNESNTIIISFNDTGEGIPEDKLNEIFDPFFTTKETGKGTGLGLAVTYGVVDRHNGKISVESKTGEGSTFTIVLPVED